MSKDEIGDFLIYNLNRGSSGLEKYDYWKVYNALKDAGLSKVFYKPLTPKEIKHFAVDLVGEDPSKYKIVYFTGSKDAAMEALHGTGLVKPPGIALSFGIVDKDYKNWVENKSSLKRTPDNGDWDDPGRVPRTRNKYNIERNRKHGLYSKLALAATARLEKL